VGEQHLLERAGTEAPEAGLELAAPVYLLRERMYAQTPVGPALR
jgi:hypothetical protein